HGTAQPRYALEVHLDKLAEQLGADPAELRLKHLVPPNSLTANYLRVGSMGLGACLEKVVAGSEWKRKFRKLPPGKGVGLACSSYICGAGLPIDRKSTRLNSSHVSISYAVFCLKKK